VQKKRGIKCLVDLDDYRELPTQKVMV